MLRTLERLRDNAGKCAEASLWMLSDTDLTVALQEVHRLEQSIAAMKLHLVAEIEGRDVPGRQNVRDTITWLRSLLLDATAARQLVEQAAALARHPVVDEALCAGTIAVRQAAAITDALDALPDTVEMAAVPAADNGEAGEHGNVVPMGTDADPVRTDTDVTAAAEAALLGFAADFAPGPLRRIGARILDHVAPQVADRLEAAALERAERRAWPQRGLILSPPAGGLVRVGGHRSCGTAGAHSRTVTGRRAGATRITCGRGPPAAVRISAVWCCYAGDTTG